MIIISGSSNRKLAVKIAYLLDYQLADVDISKFPNGEKRIWVKTKLEGQTVAILQSFSQPVDEHIIELALLVDAAKHLNARKIIAVIPWMGYSPQDKEFRKGEPVSVHVIAKIIEAIGITHLLTIEIHSLDSLKFFSVPTTHLHTLPLFVNYLKDQNLQNHLVISLDKGAREQAQLFARQLNLPICYFDKQRDRHTGEVQLQLVSGSVAGKHGIALDDFVSTGATRIQACQILKSMGLKTYTDCITHAIMAKDTAQKLQASLIDRLIVTDTYPVPPRKQIPKLTQISVAPLLAKSLSQLD